MGRTAKIVASAAVVASLAAIAVLASFENDLAAARLLVEKGGRTVSTGAGPIEFAEAGEGFPLLSIHGAGGGYDQGLANVADLVGGGFRVIAPSRFGYLGTPVPGDTSPASQAAAHSALLAELGVSRAVVVGISAGARSAVELAIRHPDKVAALILMVPAGYSSDDPVGIKPTVANQVILQLVNAGADFAWWTAEKVAPSTLISFIGVPPQVVADSSAAERDRVMAIVRSIEPLSRRVAGLNIDSNPSFPRPALEQVMAPTLIISARDDLFNTLPAAQYAARAIPGARLVVYDTGGHLLVNRGSEVRTVVADFLKQTGVLSLGAAAAVSLR